MPRLFAFLNSLDKERGPIGEIIEGGACGADMIAGQWARLNHTRLRIEYADWQRWGNAAISIRNQLMLDKWNPDIVVAAPGGAGTRDMVTRAEQAGIEVQTVV